MSHNCFEGAASTCDTLFEIIERESPDVLQLQEINGWGEGSPNTLENLAAQAGFQGIAYGNSNTRFKLGTLTRQPMINSEVLREGFWHCAVHITVPLAKDNPLHLWNVHLNPRFEDDRLPEVEQIIDQIDPDSYAVITAISIVLLAITLTQVILSVRSLLNDYTNSVLDDSGTR